MITTNVIQRTFCVRYGTSVGTAFAVDWNSRQYLVSARHVMRGFSSGDTLAIFHERQWKNLSVDVVEVGAGKIDLVVLACEVRLAPPHPINASTAGQIYGQRI